MGFVTTFIYMIALFYAIRNFDDVLAANSTFPLGAIYLQATGSRGGALGLLIVAFLPTFITCIGCYITPSRMIWTMARDNATPFSRWMSRVDLQHHNPFNASLVCGLIVAIMGYIYVSSKTAFSAFVGSFVLLS